MRSRWLLALGLCLLAAAGLCYGLLVPRLCQRIPPGWKWEARFVGSTSYPDEKTGQFPEKDSLSIYERSIEVVDDSLRPAAVVLEDRYTIYERATRKVIWEYIVRETVDPQTGAYPQPEYQGDVALFPRNTQQQIYSLRFNYLKGVPMRFEEEERVEGLDTYVFAYKGRGEYTESYAGTPAYPGVKVEPGQEIKCADDQFSIRVWVEPVTGEIVQMHERAPSGDWIYDIASGARIAPVLRWGGSTAGDDVVRRAEWIAAERTRLLWWCNYLPALLGGTGLLCALLALRRRPVGREQPKPAVVG